MGEDDLLTCSYQATFAHGAGCLAHSQSHSAMTVLIWLILKEGAGCLLMTHLTVPMLKQRLPAAGASTQAPRRWPACRQRERA